MALALFHFGLATAQEVKQIKLSERHIQGFLAATREMTKVFGEAKSDLFTPDDPKMQVQAEGVIKKSGFASLAEFGEVSDNILMIMAGIDPQTKKFHEPLELMKQAIAALKADKSARARRERVPLRAAAAAPVPPSPGAARSPRAAIRKKEISLARAVGDKTG